MPEFDFAANTSVADLKTVPPDFQALYAEDKEGGGFVLKSNDPTVKGAIAAIAGLQKALKASRQEAKDAKGKVVDLSPLSDYGDTVETITAGFQTKLQEVQTQLAKNQKIDLDKIKAEMASALSKEVKGKDDRISKLTAHLSHVLVDHAIRSALTDKVVDPDLMLPFVREQVRAMEEDGQFQVFVVDPNGSKRFSGVTAQPTSVAELVKEMVAMEKYAPLAKSGRSAGGSGSPPGGASGKGSGRPSAPVAGSDPLSKITRGLALRDR